MPAKKPEQFEMKRWLVATVEISRDEAHYDLDKPHYIETDRFVGYQGIEDHWFYADENHMLHLVFSDRMGKLLVFSDPPDVPMAMSKLNAMLNDREIQKVLPPELFPDLD